MSCPFPGMDPWLESPAVWPDFHNALAGAIRSSLNGSLPKPYYAQLNVREELEIASDAAVRHVVPDVSVQSPNIPPSKSSSSAAVLEGPRIDLAESWEIELYNEPNEVNFVEIRDPRSGHEVITLIGILSPSNKMPGKDHDHYVKKREDIISSTTSLVEIDLLRNGNLEMYGIEVYDRLQSYASPLEYLVLVQRAWKRSFPIHYQLFPARLTETLPVVAIPLRESDVEVTLDLQYAFQETYNSGPYSRAVDYAKPPHCALPEEYAAWAAERLQQAG